MTREEAIRMLIRLKDGINFEVTDSQKKMDALNMAIKSLEAWEKIEDDIYELDCWDREYAKGVNDVQEIIDKHLSEVSE